MKNANRNGNGNHNGHEKRIYLNFMENGWVYFSLSLFRSPCLSLSLSRFGAIFSLHRNMQIIQWKKKCLHNGFSLANSFRQSTAESLYISTSFLYKNLCACVCVCSCTVFVFYTVLRPVRFRFLAENIRTKSNMAIARNNFYTMHQFVCGGCCCWCCCPCTSCIDAISSMCVRARKYIKTRRVHRQTWDGWKYR